MDLSVVKKKEMTKVKAKDYQKIGEVTFQELLAYSESTAVKEKKKDLIDVFVEYTYKKFELGLYIIKEEMKEAIFLRKDEKAMLYEVFIQKKYLESEEKTVDNLKKIIGLT